MIKIVFFDAVGTLFHLTETVGHHYALVGRELGLELDPAELDQAFVELWRATPPRPAIKGPRENDDKDWWRELVNRIFEKVAPGVAELDRDNYFEVAYEHFAEAGVWQLYPEVYQVLENLRPAFRLAVISNFDGRLRMILEHLGISKFFSNVFVSSEIGADKPNPVMFQRALKFMDALTQDVLHVGDDPERDWAAAERAGLDVFRLERPGNSLNDVLRYLQ